MKNSIKVFATVIALAISGSAIAQHNQYRNNHHNHHNHYQNDRRGCGNNCVLGIIGAGVIGGLIINEVNRQPVYVQSQPVYNPPPVYYNPPPVYYAPPPPRIVYVPSTMRCDGGQWINNTYSCPRYVD